jgi:hypothetical protein
MINKNISIIGTSKITTHHIIAAKKVGFTIYSIAASRRNSRYLAPLAKKYKIKKIYYSWKECIKESIKKYKDISFIITTPISKNKIILDYILKYNSKILVEKPVFNNPNQFKKLNKNKKNIFVGYNRIFYRNVEYLKQILNKKSNLNVICNIPEFNKDHISSNSCHIFSILYFIFGNLKFIKKIESKNYINVHLVSKISQINLFFNFKASENFSIKIYDKKKIYILSPIEKLIVYNDMKIINSNNQNFYKPIKTYSLNSEMKKIKPGFYKQYISFLSFVKNKKVINDINFAHNIQKLANKILKS